MELTLEILDEAIRKVRKFRKAQEYQVAFLNSRDWRKCMEATKIMANVKSSGKYLWGMRVIAIPEIPEDTMILYNSPDNYRVVKHIRVDPTHSKEGGENGNR